MGTILESGVRHDLVEAHRQTVAELADPGTWWTAREGIAIAREIRRARDHADLAPWEAPSALPGVIEDDHVLPASAVDAVWRLTNHPGTLTRDWYDATVAGLPTPEHYVELVGIVAALNAVDRFAETLSLDRLPLPEPRDGEPTRARLVDARATTHWVPTVGGRGPHVVRALSAVPAADATRARLSEAQYVPAEALLGDLDWDRGTLDRRQIELLAAETSLLNDCFY